MIHYGSIGVGGLDGWRWGCLDNGVDRILAKIDEPETFVHFEFVGGSLDGKIYEGPLANPFYWSTEHGKIGYRFKVASEVDVDAMIAGEPTGPILKHACEIAENRVEDGIRTVQANAI